MDKEKNNKKKFFLKGGRMIEGVNIVLDSKGRKKAILIDLEEFGDVWEDIYDIILARIRKREKKVPWKNIKNK